MKNFILLSEHPDIHSSTRFLEVASKLGLKTDVINPYDELLELMNNHQNNFDETLIMHRVTGIRYGNYDINYSKSLEAKGAKVVNSLNSFKNLRDKEEQGVFFHKNNIPVIPAISLRKRVGPEDFDTIVSKLSRYNKDNEYILKALRGHQGIGTNLINGTKSLKSFLETFWAIRDQDFLIQPYLKGGTEYRVLMSKRGILGAIKRSPKKNDFRANSHFGEALKLDNLPESIVDFALNAFNKANVTYAALDILHWEEKNFLIEINLVPGFKQMEEVTGNDIAAQIIHDSLE